MEKEYLGRGVSIRRGVPRDEDVVEGVAGWDGISKRKSLAGGQWCPWAGL